MNWIENIKEGLKSHGVDIISYVPDKVTWRVLKELEADPFFTVIPAAREEESLGIACGVYAAKGRAAVFMQSSGLGNSINAISTLAIPYRIPFLMFISLRGDLGEFNSGQVAGGKAVRPILDALGIQHYTLNREDEVEKIVKGGIELCFNGREPLAILLPTILTGGKRGTS